MFKTVRVTKFKGLEDIEITFGKLNIFVGENGVGKSTIAHALGLIKKSSRTTAINTDLPYINLGSIDKLVPSGERASIIISGNTDTKSSTPIGNSLQYEIGIEFDYQGLYSTSSKLSFELYGRPTLIQSKWIRYGTSYVDPKQLQIYEATYNLQPTNFIAAPINLQGYSLSPSSPQTQEKASKNFVLLSQVLSLPAEAIQKISIVPVFRGFLEPAYPLQPTPMSDFNIRGLMSQLGASVASNLAYIKPQIKQKIREWMKEVMDVDVEWYPVPGGQIAIVNPEKETYFVNEGFGTNQLTFILEEFARADEGSLVIVEEPEIHLHPRAQFKFGKLMAKVIRERQIQIILVTHSEHIVSGILSSIKIRELGPEDVSIFLFEKKNGKVSITRSNIAEDGTTDLGLKTFIQASISELEEVIS